MEQVVLALDQGTTSSRALLFDRSGRIVASAQKEVTQHYPQPGWVEHDATELWSGQLGAATEALARAGRGARDVAAIGITNQRETTILWDRESGEPLHRAIVWQDRRTAAHVDRLKADGLEPMFQDRTGLVLDAYFSASKLRWLLDELPGARERAEAGEVAFGTVDSWLLYKLTGGAQHLTDASNASRTLLMNLRTLHWDDDLLKIMDVPSSVLPEIRPSSGLFAEADLAGPLSGIPIAGVAGDQQAATFGQACFEVGQGKNTYGTGAFMVMNTGPEPVASQNKLLSTLAWQTERGVSYALEGSVFIAGALVQWLRDGLSIIRRAEEVEALAASVPDTGGVFVVPAFAGLGAPHWDPYARGAVLGLTRGSTGAHIARAALEAVALQVADVVAAMERDSGVQLSELRVDGGMAVNDLMLQMQADLLGVPVVRPHVTETTALGAAYLAGLAVGFWDSEATIAAQWAEDKRFEPGIGDAERERRRSRWHEALERAANWAREGE